MNSQIASLIFTQTADGLDYKSVIIRRTDGKVREYELNTWRRLITAHRVVNPLTTSPYEWACIQSGWRIELTRRLPH